MQQKPQFTSYKPLPQFSESDSDVDIFNAKSHIIETPNPRYKEDCQSPRVRKCIFMLLLVVLVISAVISISINYRRSMLRPQSVLVATDCGFIEGKVVNVPVTNDNSKVCYVFNGIPYAKPPVKKLRWQRPVIISASNDTCWKGTYKAYQKNIKCLQGVNVGTEDCLYLHVYTPLLDRSANLPVFVYIHGGYLMDGYSDEKGYTPDEHFAIEMNVVAVSINYRLNAFGFLTLKELWREGTSYANFGLWDQIVALRWIQNNIKNFGGNPNSVTICGQSSGGTSIFGLLVSPLAEGLFHRAIPVSGSPKFEMKYTQAAEDNRVFIKNTKCKYVTTPDNIRQCLYSLTANELYKSIPETVYPNWAMDDQLDFPTFGLLDGALAVVDPIVITVPPAELEKVKWGRNQNISVLVGSMAQEIGYDPLQRFFGNDSWPKLTSSLDERVRKFTGNMSANFIIDLYNATAVIKNHTDAQYYYETISSDVRVNCPTTVLKKSFMRSKNHRVYQYIASHEPYKPITYENHTLYNAFHAWDIFALFGFRKFPKNIYTPNDDDIAFMKILRKVYKQFMVSGNLDDFKWKAGQTVIIDKGVVSVLPDDYHSKQCEFWNNPEYGFANYAWIN